MRTLLVTSFVAMCLAARGSQPSVSPSSSASSGAATTAQKPASAVPTAAASGSAKSAASASAVSAAPAAPAPKFLYRRMLLEQIECVEPGEDPLGVIRNPAKNTPWIQLPVERTLGYTLTGVPASTTYEFPNREVVAPAGAAVS